MKYFFLSDGWTIGRVWGSAGLWNEHIWRRKPRIQKLTLYLVEQQEKLWLYQVEEAVIMVEVMPEMPDTLTLSNHPTIGHPTIGQVVLKRLITSEQVLERLAQAEGIGLGPSGLE